MTTNEYVNNHDTSDRDERRGPGQHPHPQRGEHGETHRHDRNNGHDRNSGRPEVDGPVEGSDGDQAEASPRGRGGRRGGRGHGRPRPGDHRGGGRRGGRRQRRGDVRAALLLLIDEQPRHGYELMLEISERTEGAWVPSPGSVYPALQLLQDEGLIELATDDDGRRIASLTPAGEQYVNEHRQELQDDWAAARSHSSRGDRDLSVKMKGLVMAYRQVKSVGSGPQLKAAGFILEDSTRALYGVLAQRPDEDPEVQDPQSATDAER